MAEPVITFPDAVSLALPYVRTLLADPSVTVAAKVPAVRPARLVVLRRAGGTETTRGLQDRPRIDVQAWDKTEFDALALCDRVRAYLRAAPGRVAGVTLASTFLGPTPIPDPDSSTPRALATVEWRLRGTQEA